MHNIEYQQNEDQPFWNKVNNRFQDSKNTIKNKIWNSKMIKYNQWKVNFDREMDISFLQGSFSDLKNEINDKRYSQDKYIHANPFSQVIDVFFKPFNEEYLKRGNMQFFKDFGMQRKEYKSKLGLCGAVGVSNLVDSSDRLKMYMWTGIHDSVNNEMSFKMNYFSPNLPPESNANNLQFKGRLQQINHEQREYLYQGKYQTADEGQGWIYSFQSKLYVNEHRGIDRPSFLFCVNRKSLPNKTYGDKSTMTSFTKQIVGFDYTRKSLFLKTLFHHNYQKLFTFDVGSDSLLYLNFINNYQKGSIINIRQMILNEKLFVNYQPGYVNHDYNEANQGLLHSIQNTSKIEVIKFIPNFDPFVQINTSIQLKNLRFGQYFSFKQLVQDHCKLVLSAGSTVDLGFVKVGLYYNFLDLIPYFFKNPQKESFQNFQIHFSS